MIIGTGIDLADPVRLQEATERHPNLLQRLFTDREREACEKLKDPWPRYAGRFAAKEALLKALGTGLRKGISWQDIETINDTLGKPGMVLTGRARAIADDMGVDRIHLSVSNMKEVAAASVVLETGA
jgi:holo-[acyl-carrier protein] synthase